MLPEYFNGADSTYPVLIDNIIININSSLQFAMLSAEKLQHIIRYCKLQ